VNKIKASATPPQMFSSTKTPPMLNIRPTVEERKMVQCIKPSSHCQNCTHCTKTAVVHHSQWIYCNNPSRITANGSNRHYWHTPELALPCHSQHSGQCHDVF
jgi:molybdenum cofactor biosynthesis enzyme MoaA